MSWMPIQNVNQIRRNCKNAGFFNGRSWLNIWKTTWNEIFQLLFFAGNVNHIPSFRINAGSSVQANLIHSFIFKLSCAPHSYIGILMVKIVWNMTIRLPIKYWNFDNFQWQLPTKASICKIEYWFAIFRKLTSKDLKLDLSMLQHKLLKILLSIPHHFARPL